MGKAKKGQRGGSRPGSGRPRKYNGGAVTLSFACPPDLPAMIDADRGEQSRSEYVVEALRRYLRSRQRGRRSNAKEKR